MAERDFFDVMKESLKAIGPEIGAEFSRMGKQGSLELAQALFNGAAFTPYGPGQYTPTVDLDKGGHEPSVPGIAPPEHQPERGGREM